jgi:hypothetical protein
METPTEHLGCEFPNKISFKFSSLCLLAKKKYSMQFPKLFKETVEKEERREGSWIGLFLTRA